ncbi:hypothetical protein JKP88DRAFT_163480 [Tribonema minus]|uniref:Bro-N domain-containing protein n=1 Tax=Tribonema minus TaxID=303371 RepID=A0A835Z6A6_9STRA|nr:hypothetical protein JKP88DRAFT_163480 [Tribonema minus]
MDIIKTFVSDNTSYALSIYYKNNVPLFRASDIGDILGLSQVRSSIRDFDETEKVAHVVPTAGGDQQVLCLTEAGVYLLLMSSKKPIARPFRKWLCQVLKSIQAGGSYELEQQFKEQMEKEEKNMEKAIYVKVNEDLEKQKHNDILEVYDKKPLVYIARFGSINDLKIIKVGSTTDIKQRVSVHWRDFSDCTLLRVFHCSERRGFESFLHKHHDIRKYKYEEPINGKKSDEAFLLSDDKLKQLINIAVRKVSKYQVTSSAMQSLQQDVSHMKQMLEKLQSVDIAESEPQSRRGVCTVNGDKVQRYSEDGTTLIDTYFQMITVERDEHVQMLAMRFGMRLNRNSIVNTITKQHTYLGFRWAMLNRALPDHTVQDIGTTTPPPTLRSGPVVELSDDKATIVRVFENSEAARISVNERLQDLKQSIKTISRLCKAIKSGDMYKGRYYTSWAECSWAMQDAYMAAGGSTPFPAPSHCRPIHRSDPKTKRVLETYYSMSEVQKKRKVGKSSLQNAINGEYTLQGYLWAYAT